MDPPGLKRRLTCILATDAVGYSRLVSEDEENALRILAAHRAVIDGIITFHDGRIVSTAGDSVLAEFRSVVDAVRCAIEIQDALKTRNESLPEPQRMLFRIGINHCAPGRRSIPHAGLRDKARRRVNWPPHRAWQSGNARPTNGMEDSRMIKLYGVSVSNYYNKVKFSLLEKGIAFSEETMAPSEDEALLARSPMGKVPCIDVDGRPLSESQAIVEYLDAVQPQPRLIPADPYAAAKCRELIAFMELYLDLPARRLLGHALFGAPITEEVKQEVARQLDRAVARFPRIAHFGGYLCGDAFTLADISAFVHLPLVSFLTTKVLGRDVLAPLVGVPACLQRIGARPHAQHVTRDRDAAMARMFAPK